MAIAEINPFAGRQEEDAYNTQKDMRARLFRERNTAAFGILTDPNPPVLQKVPLKGTAEELTRISNRVVTTGEEEFRAANRLAAKNKTEEAIREFERLRRDYPDSWIDQKAAERILELRSAVPKRE